MRYFGGFSFDEAHGLLWQDGVRVPLTAKASAVLACLIDAGDRPVTKTEILRNVWRDTHVTPDNVKVLIREIRLALGDDARSAHYIRTIAGSGYAFIAPIHKNAPVSGAYANPIFCGRHGELAALGAVTPPIVEHPMVTVVMGPPGVGKTALVERALKNASRRGCIVVRAQCVPSSLGVEPYAFLLDTMSRLITDVPRVRDLIEPHAPALLRHLQSADSRRSASIAEVATPSRLMRELVAALEAVAWEAPFVLSVEDAQWLDAGDIDVIGALVRRRRPVRLSIIATSRPLSGADGNDRLRQLIAELEIARLCKVVPLGSLTYGDVAQYVERRFGRTLAQDLHNVLYTATQGHPLLLTTAADTLVENGNLRREHGRWIAIGSESEMRRTIQGALAFVMSRQLQQLSTDDQLLLAAVSEIGTEFSAWTAGQVLGREPGDIGSRLDRLARRGDIVEHAREDDGLAAEMRFRFSNPWYRDLLRANASVTHLRASGE